MYDGDLREGPVISADQRALDALDALRSRLLPAEPRGRGREGDGPRPRRAGAANVVEVYGAAGALGPAMSAWLASQGAGARAAGAPRVVYVVPDEDMAEARVRDLEFFSPTPPPSDDPLAPPHVLWLPAPELSPYTEMQPDRRALLAGMAALFRLSSHRAPALLVVSASALCRRFFPRAPFDALSTRIARGDAIARDDTVRALSGAGYGKTAVVEDPGTFAVRGAVIDVFPPVYRHPVRIELFGDEVESVRLYDVGTQRTLREIPEVHVHPVRDTICTAGANPRARLQALADAAIVPSSKIRHTIDQIESGESFFGAEALAPAYHASMDALTAYLPPEVILAIEEPGAVLDEMRRALSKLRETASSRRVEHRIALEPTDFVLSEPEARRLLSERDRLELRTLEIEPEPEPGPSAAGEPARATEAEAPGADPSTWPAVRSRLRLRAESNAALKAELHQAQPSPAAGDGPPDRHRDRSGAPPASLEPHAADADTHLGRAFRERLRQWMAAGQRVRLVASNRTHSDRLTALLTSWELAPSVLPSLHASLPELLDPKSELGSPRLAVLTGTLSHGFRLPAERLVLVAEEEIFGRRQTREARPSKLPTLGDLGEIAEGDVIVHDDHGVGRYRGLKKLAVRGVTQDFLHLEYDGGLVYVPVYRVGLLHRFLGGDGEAVRLDKLGGKTWAEKRRRVSVEARKIAEELLQLYAQRAALSGFAFPAPDAVFRELEETFPFEETPDQAKAIEAVLGDMQSERPMDRLVCGDVGYGKTEVALRATMLAVQGGKQVAVLAPTTVLAEQHFVTFSERFSELPVNLAVLSRFRGRADQQRTIAELAAGKVDVVVGTHRVLSRDVRFRDLGLVVIDEEQRFGVTHKERLKELRTQVDVLTLTATPIPRTLQMAIGGLREISIIATPPADRLAIRTFVCRWTPELLREAVHKELARGGQIFFVHNRIEDLAEWTERMRELAPPETRLAMAHGQMAEGELEKIMIDFVDGKIDILVSTTIIESGLDIPRANTMIVNHAERFGLAQLYQMRGRIGRSRERAFCYLVVPSGESSLTPEAKQRLSVLQRFTELGAGFQVATHDLEIRGAGELLGDKQSGAVATVGFETYSRILEEAVAELKGQPIRNERDPEISADVPAFLPDDYVPDTGQRLDFYRRLAQASDEDDIRATLAELEDRYGPVPEEGRLLGEVMGHKLLVRAIGALGYELGPARMLLALGPDSPLEPASVMRLVSAKHSRWKLSPDMRLTYAFDDADKRDRLAAARARLGELLALRPRTG